MSSQSDFIARIAPVVQKMTAKYGYGVNSAIIAQACLESAYGTSNKAKHHNYFGLKYRPNRVSCSSGIFKDGSREQLQGGKYIKIIDNWFGFASMKDGVEGYLQFISIPNYDRARAVTDPEEYLQALKDAGYATSAAYVSNNMSVIKKWDLTKYDTKKVDISKGSVKVVEKPKITKMISKYNFESRSGNAIKYIVLHYTGNQTDTAKNNANYFATGNRGASAHYFVDETSIYQSVEDSAAAWHVGKNYGSGNLFGKCTNKNSIGIEMCSKNGAITSKTITQAVELTRYLMAMYAIPIDNVVRHYDVCSKKCLPVDNTELLTPNGWISLEDVQVGDMVAQFNTEDDSINFTEVLDKVPFYEAETLKHRNLEATADHRMWCKPNVSNSKRFREELWSDVLSSGGERVVKTHGFLKTDGIPITDDELAYIVWVQADGHYMHQRWAGKDNIYGVEFHVKKERKKIRIKELLDSIGWEYKINNKSNGSVSYRIYGKEPYLFAEKWLSNKEFTYNLINMNEHQFNIFWNELLQADGCRSGNIYTSSKIHNLDVVQAICAVHGKRMSMTTLGTSRNSYGEQPTGILENRRNAVFGRETKSSPVEKRNTVVSCVTVESGFVLIRQNKRTFVVGNCPGWYGWNPKSGSEATWEDFKERIQSGETQKAAATSTAKKKTKVPFIVKVTIPDLNIRKGPGVKYGKTGKYTGIGKFTIIETDDKEEWGRLKSGAGWIYIADRAWTKWPA